MIKNIKYDLAQFHERSDSKGLMALFSQYTRLLICAVSIYLLYIYADIYTYILIYPLLAFVMASIFFGFFVLLHEASHNNLFKTKKLNSYVELLGSFFIFEELNVYKKNHSLHHKYLNKENDPEKELIVRWKLQKQSFLKNYILNFIFLLYTCDFIRFQFIPFIFNRHNLYRKFVFYSFLFFIGYCIGFYNLFWIYILPIMVFYPYVYFLGVAHEHLLVKSDNRHQLSVTANNILGFFNNLLHPFNDGYHTIHHIDPLIPFYKLPEAHKFIKKKYGILFIETSFESIIINAIKNETTIESNK